MTTLHGITELDLWQVASAKGGAYTLQDVLYGLQTIHFPHSVIERLASGEVLAAHAATFRLRSDKPNGYNNTFLRPDLVYSPTQAMRNAPSADTAVNDLERLTRIGMSMYGMERFQDMTATFERRMGGLSIADRAILAGELGHKPASEGVYNPNHAIPRLGEVSLVRGPLVKAVYNRLPGQPLNTQPSLFS